MQVPIDRMVSKQKIIGCPDIGFGVGELVGAQLVTLSFYPKLWIADGHKMKLLLAHNSGYPGWGGLWSLPPPPS